MGVKIGQSVLMPLGTVPLKLQMTVLNQKRENNMEGERKGVFDWVNRFKKKKPNQEISTEDEIEIIKSRIVEKIAASIIEWDPAKKKLLKKAVFENYTDLRELVGAEKAKEILDSIMSPIGLGN